jgi:redox-sensitive bicupin YhaK (pirin superfamily)
VQPHLWGLSVTGSGFWDVGTVGFVADGVADGVADAEADGVIRERFELGFQWPAFDPFLFCVHHIDDYPAGNDELGPRPSLDGRELGADFAGIDGWRMYHGLTVPGFPGHPHRGFETVTFVQRGLIDHSDSLGATARFGRGDTQWLTAGRGIVHSEMFPLVNRDAPNPTELFQIWLNLPAADKMVDPYFTMLWADDIPVVVLTDDNGRKTEVVVIAGELAGHRAPPPPPNSWATRPEGDIAIWQLRIDADGQCDIPPAATAATTRTLYVYDGAVTIDGSAVEAPTGVVVQADVRLPLQAGSAGATILMLQGRPIAEPVAQYGPFVMNTRSEVAAAFDDYRATGFGGWPFDRPDPVHARDQERFARHANGHVETAAAR